MFTGIIRKVIPIYRVVPQSSGMELYFRDAEISSTLREGDSVAVDGICTTVRTLTEEQWSCEIGRETLEKTVASRYRSQLPVNIELSLEVSDRLNGHIVTGHVDGTGKILDIRALGEEQKALLFSYPSEMKPYLVYKGSIALQGVSLTLNEVRDEFARVNIVSYIFRHTTFHNMSIGDELDIETDLLAKYVNSWLQSRKSNSENNLLKTLKNSGYM